MEQKSRNKNVIQVEGPKRFDIHSVVVATNRIPL